MEGVTLLARSNVPDLINSKSAGILGPIKNGDVVYIGRLQSADVGRLNTLYVGKQEGAGCTISDNDGVVAFQLFDGTTSSEESASLINSYEIRGTYDDRTQSVRVIFTNTETKGVLGLVKTSSGKNVLAELSEGSIPTSFQLSQNVYSRWSLIHDQVIALSFINYTLSPTTNEVVYYCASSTCTSPDDCENEELVVPLTEVFLVPKEWFARCSRGSSGTKITSMKSGLCSALCAAQSLQSGNRTIKCGGSGSGGLCEDEPLLGFTQSSDCKNGFRYEYCMVPMQCEGTCQSACADDRQVCTFEPRDNNAGVYQCIGATGSMGMACTGTDQGSCPSGEQCLRGRCQKFCVNDQECPTNQECIDKVCQVPILPKKEREILIVIAIVIGTMVLGLVIFVFYLFSAKK